MQKIIFTKMVASGNDFIILATRYSSLATFGISLLAKKICDRKFGVGADGLLVLGKSKIADVRMRIFNPDGSEAEMCGNGARCVAFYNTSNQKPVTRSQLKIETKAGIIESEVNGENVKIKLTDPKDIKLDISLKINKRNLKVNFINTGVPHTVIFVYVLDKLDVFNLGRQIRYHNRFRPDGTNVDFVEIRGDDYIKIRTYERGVEDETLACGTGAVASALILALKTKTSHQIKARTQSGEILKVYFKQENNKLMDVWLQGKAGIVFRGQFNYYRLSQNWGLK